MGDRVFVGSCAGRFYCIERRTGTEVWSYDITQDGAQRSFHGDPLVAGELILVGTDGDGIGHVYAFEHATGKVRWKHPITHTTERGGGLPTDLIRLDSSVFGVALGDELLSLDLETGRLNWSFRSQFSDFRFAWTSTPAAAGGRVFFGGLDGTVYALDARSGRVLWKREIGPAIHSSVTLVGEDLVVGSANGHLYRLAQATGNVVADVDVGAPPWGRFLVAGDALLLFAGRGDAASIVCVDLTSNRVRWNQRPDGVLNTSRPYLWHGAALTGNEGGDLFVYRLSDGQLDHSFHIDGGARGIGITAEALYVGTLGGTVYALEAAARPDEPKTRVGAIDFFGTAGLDLERVRAAVPVRQGDELANDQVEEAVGRIRQAVRQVTGRDATDVAAVCCDERGSLMIYVGLPGSSIRDVRFSPVPKGAARLPVSAVELYRQSMDLLVEAIRSGQASEDDSKGYSLSAYPALREKQLAIRAFALTNAALVRRVLESASDVEHRQAAAHVLGYANRSKAQIAALVRASFDRDETVRNNAVRALAVIAGSDRQAAREIRADRYVSLLSSGSWTDRNKGLFLLETLSRGRDPKLLGLLRSSALDALVEMARWQAPGHAYTARLLLGRIAGIEESALQRLVDAGDVDTIVGRLRDGARIRKGR